MMTIEDRCVEICDTIGVKEVTVVAISKKQPFSVIEEAYEMGIRHFGENYVQEALPKIEQGKKDKLAIKWHYVGALQTNKMNKIVPEVMWLHAIDSWSQIEKLSKMLEQGIVLPKLLVQLNLAKEDTKSGLIEKDIKAFFEKVEATKLKVSGLMTFPPLQTDPEKNRPYFAKMKQWQDKINSWKLKQAQIKDLSMGVSNDYQVAVEEGATIVRLGEAIFGPRTP
jgi:pyridoxal phosphate enzyme (YggS family)